MKILVCVKRVPAPGARINITADGQAVDTAFLGFTTSPHEECALEAAVQLVEAGDGEVTVLTLGPAEAEEQLRYAASVGATNAVLLATDGSDWDPQRTARAITKAVGDLEAADGPFDLVLFGNESADSGGFQVGIRVAVELGRPVVNGIKSLSVGDGSVVARREAIGGGWETYELPLPAVIGVKEGINLPRYPSVPGRLRAKKKEVERLAPAWSQSGPVKVGLRLPEEQRSRAEVLGQGADAAPAVVDLLERIGVLP
jgi:electron transfer flavoprotein beta subunit